MIKTDIWLIGDVIEDDDGHELGWMCEGVFTEESDAIENCRKDWFIARVKLNEMLPEKIEDANCIYWPCLQTKADGMARLAELKINEKET